MRIVIETLGGVDDADHVEESQDLGGDIGDLGTVEADGLSNLLSNGENGVQRR